MIIIEPLERSYMACQSCGAPRSETPITSIGIKYDGMNQSSTFRLCGKCIDELKEKLEAY